MNEDKSLWQRRWDEGRNRGLILGLFLVGAGAFWLLGNLELVAEPARFVIPGLVILWGIAILFKRDAPR
jgi:hypothetical protein